MRISGGQDPLSPSGSAHAFEHPTYIGGGVGGWGVSVIQKTLNPLHVHRLRKCLDAFHNDYRGRKQNLLVKRAWILGEEYVGGGVSVIQKTLNPLHVHRLRKCLDAFHNDYRGRKQNLLVKRAWILGN